jgi:teichuronic acid exporter
MGGLPAETRKAPTGSRMVHSIGWTGAATWATQLITWAYMIILARMLTPSDFGLIGMATLVLEILTVASEFGVGVAIVMLPDLSDHQISQLNTVAILSSAALFAVSCAAAYPVGHFFRAPGLPIVIVVLSLGLIIISFQIVPAALLQREVRFKLLAKIQAAQVVAYGLAAVISVFWGAGYWSLVIANLAGVSVLSVLTLGFRRHAFAWPRLASIRKSLVFSMHVFGFRLAWFCNSNSDFAVAGRVLGKAALGSYNVAWNLAMQPLQKFSDLVTRVVPAYFSKVHDNSAALRQYVLTITQALSLVMLPATLGLSLVADDFIAFVFGPKWVNSVTPLRLLAIYAAARSITSFFAPLLNVRGESRFVMWNHLLALLYFPAGFYLGSHWGVAGIALMWPLLYLALAGPLYWRLFRQISLSWRAYLTSLRPALTGSLFMVVALLVLKRLLLVDTAYLRLAIEIVTGAVIYCLVLAALYSGELRRAYALIRPAPPKLALAPEGN